MRVSGKQAVLFIFKHPKNKPISEAPAKKYASAHSRKSSTPVLPYKVFNLVSKICIFTSDLQANIANYWIPYKAGTRPLWNLTVRELQSRSSGYASHQALGYSKGEGCMECMYYLVGEN
jgi:hypothetical protein